MSEKKRIPQRVSLSEMRLLQHYRTMHSTDRKYLQRLAEALAVTYSIGKLINHDGTRMP